MIFLESSYGLANRMRSIASGVGLSLLQGGDQKLNVIWPKNKALNCAFEELFNPIAEATVSSAYKRSNLLKSSHQSRIDKRMAAAVINKILGIDHCVKADADFHLSEAIAGELPLIVKKKRNIYIKTCAEFGAIDHLLGVFKPISSLQREIDKRKGSYSDNTIGLHIRRSDHIAARANSPLSMFIAAIEKELDKHPGVKFYLSTDDTETVEVLSNLFPEQIIYYQKDLSRDSSQGIRDAVIDMYCLAGTHKIYGSFNSSFSDVAARIGQIDLVILKISNSPNSI